MWWNIVEVDTTGQEELSAFMLIGRPEFYRKMILGHYHDLVLELEIRQQQRQEQHALATAADDCTNAPGVLVDGINAVETQLATILGSLPLGAVVQNILISAFKVLLATLDGSGKLIGTALTAVSINLSFGTLKGALSLLALIKVLKPILNPIIDILSTVQTTILNTVSCFAGKGYHFNRLEQPEDDNGREQQQQRLPLSVGHCAWIAKNYQQVVSDAIAHNLVTTGRLPEESSEDLRRLTQGSLDTLEWMQKYSIASNLNLPDMNDNEGDGDGINLAAGFTLTGQPFFAGKILDQFRVALIETATTEAEEAEAKSEVEIEAADQYGDREHDETVLYALTSLALTINLSNALEACLSAVE